MSTASLSISSSIISISFDRMATAKRKIDRAHETAQAERDDLSRAIDNLQVDDGRLRMKADALRTQCNKINNRVSSLQKTGTHIDHVVQRFKETDDLCAQRIKSNGYDCRKSLGLVKKGGLLDNIVGGIVSVYNKGKAAWHSITKAVGDFYEKHKVLINNIATIALEVGAIILTAAAVSALTITGVGLVVAVAVAAAGIAYSSSNIVDSGVKIYNYCTTGKEIGFNPLEKSFQAAFGDELGEKIYTYTGIAVTVANVAVGAEGLVKAGIQAKNALKSGEAIEKVVAETGGFSKQALLDNLAKSKAARNASRFGLSGTTSETIPLSQKNVLRLLEQRGLDPEMARSLNKSFDGTVYTRWGKAGETFTVTENSFQDSRGIFMTKSSAGATPYERINNLALPPSNKALVESQVRLTRDQILLEGTVAKQSTWAKQAIDGIPRIGGGWQVVSNGGKIKGAIEWLSP